MRKQGKAREIIKQDCGRQEGMHEVIVLTTVPIFSRTSTAEALICEPSSKLPYHIKTEDNTGWLLGNNSDNTFFFPLFIWV